MNASNHNQQLDEANHKFLVEFIALTENDGSQVTGSIKTTVTQFLMTMRKELHNYNRLFGDEISAEALILLQMQVLRCCIADLGMCLNEIKDGVTIQ